MLQEKREVSTNQIFHSLGVLLLLDSPNKLHFGIDNISWEVGHKFKGVKMIPLGTHIIAYSLESEAHNFTISKFMQFTSQKRILVYRWDPALQQFRQARGEQSEGYRDGVKQYYFDAYLGPYPQQNVQFWRKTTNYIGRQVLDKLDPIQMMGTTTEEYGGKREKEGELEEQIGRLDLDEEQEGDAIEQIDEEDSEGEEKNNENKDNKEKKEKGHDQIAPISQKFQPTPGTIYYSSIPRSLTADPSIITSLNLDKTPILLRLIFKQHKGNTRSFLGQIQYSFVHFVIGQCQQSLEQWKKLVDVVVMAQGAYYAIQNLSGMKQYCKGDKNAAKVDLLQLMMEFIVVLYDQLSQFPADFFRDELSKDNFLCRLLKRLKEYQVGQEYQRRIRMRIGKLMKMIREKFDYQVELEQEQEEMPVVVEEGQSYF